VEYDTGMTPGANSGFGASGSTMGDGSSAPVTQQVKEKVGETASRVMDQTREQVFTRLDQQKEQVVGTIGGVAQALRQTGQQLQEGEQANISQYIDQAAEWVDGISGYLRDREIGDLVNDVEDLARRQPAIFIGGAFALGFLTARFLKSSGRRAQEMLPVPMEDTGYRSSVSSYETAQSQGHPLPSAYDRAQEATAGTGRVNTADMGTIDTATAAAGEMTPPYGTAAIGATPATSPATGATGFDSSWNNVNEVDDEEETPAFQSTGRMNE
jgi:hypothetical protein